MSKQRCADEFETEAVKQETERGHRAAEVAARRGVSRRSRCHWMRARRSGAGGAPAPLAREQKLRNFLGQHRFSGELASTLVGPMPGGEKARLALALIACEKPNVLLLDEPTNHLDLETRDAPTRATAGELWLVHDARREQNDTRPGSTPWRRSGWN